MRSRRSQRHRAVAALALVSALACSFGAAEASATTAGTAAVQPLTGLPIDGELAATTPRPAMVVKIDNVNAEPQAGLNEADIVFEEIVEASQTRFAAVFNSQGSDPVGPIRSGRTQDINITAALNDPIFVWSGGNEAVTSVLEATGMTLFDQGAPSMRRDSTYNEAPHNLFADTSELWMHDGESGDAVPIFEYSDVDDEIDGTPVASVHVRVGGRNVDWTYDVQHGVFLRAQDGHAHETTTGQTSTNNVVMVLTEYGTSAADSRSPEAVTTGHGEVVVYTRGERFEGTWTRANATDPWTLEADGQPLLLEPGRTFVELIDVTDYELTDDAD